MGDPKVLAVGSIVTHRALPNSPRMRVKAVSSEGVDCDWFDKNHVYRTAQFPFDELGDEGGMPFSSGGDYSGRR